MFSKVIFSILAGASIASAALECPGSGAYYVCARNGFRGYCSSDPCDKDWCPDFSSGTCDSKWSVSTTSTTTTTTLTPTPTPTQCPGSGAYYRCFNNGFNGYCSTDPCALDWCPDFAPKTCDKKVDSTGDSSGESHGSDGSSGAYYVCAANQFRGYCSVDACNYPWCPDYYYKSYERIAKRDDTVCLPGTGYFQSCSNGFRGCCKSDACGASWCPDYKLGSYEPISSGFTTSVSAATVPTPTPAPLTNADSTVCSQGQGYYQVCGNGFKGCCKSDACSLGYCPNY